MYPFDLNGKIAIITGGSTGIGLSIAEILLQAGCKIAITGRSEEKLQDAKAGLQAQFNDSDILVIPSDASSIVDIKAMVAKVETHFGQIDILVNNAGTNVLNKALEVTEEEWDRIMNLNLKGLFFCCQEVGKRMVQQKSGKIINIGSQMGLVGLYDRVTYCASKGGVVQLTKVLAIEWARDNVQVNTVAPTFVETALTKPMLENEEFYNDIISRIPMGKVAQPKDVAGAVLYLASDLSQFVTGHTLLVDGGWVAW